VGLACAELVLPDKFAACARELGQGRKEKGRTMGVEQAYLFVTNVPD
jgi:hypothetical protein